MKLRILKQMETAYNSLYDLQNAKGITDRYEETLKDIEKRAKNIALHLHVIYIFSYFLHLHISI